MRHFSLQSNKKIVRASVSESDSERAGGLTLATNKRPRR
jgi:hypothetical protein